MKVKSMIKNDKFPGRDNFYTFPVNRFARTAGREKIVLPRVERVIGGTRFRRTGSNG